MKTTVVNSRTDEFDVFIGRPSDWGNPYEIGVDGNREQVIKLYRLHLKYRPDLIERLSELKGKRLGCFCHPLPCHGDILVELLDA